MPLRRFVRRTLAAVLLCAPLLAAAQDDCPPPPAPPSAEALAQAQREARDRGFLWRIEKDGRSSWLYGTVHLARLEWLFPGPRVREAFARSDTLALELDLLDAETQKRLAAGTAARPGEALAGELRQRIERRARLECAPAAAIAPLKPEFQVAALSMLAGRRLGLEPGYGIDAALAALARREGKPVLALESAEDQLRALGAGSRAERAELVKGALDELDSGRAQALLGLTARAWANGDHALLERHDQWCECRNTPAEAAALRRLLDARHPAMAARLDALHGGGREVFAAVGSLHLIGPRGLPALMAQRGYRVERIVLEAPMPDIQALWDFDDPAASEQRFRAARDAQARRWEGSLLNNLGWVLHDAGRHEEALAQFRAALAARERDGAPTTRVREARWAVARELRALGRHDEALALLRALEAELAAAGASDPFVPEEIAENLRALSR